MVSTFSFPLPVASRLRLRATTSRFPLGPTCQHVSPFGLSTASFPPSRRQRPSFPRRSPRWFLRRSRGPSVGGEPNHALQRTATGVPLFFVVEPCVAGACR